VIKINGTVVELSLNLMERVYETLKFYANECSYEAPRIGGVLAGCPRGETPTTKEMTFHARRLLKEIDALRAQCAKENSK
jgi:hypothetical protein